MSMLCRQKIQLCQALLLLRINSTERLREKLMQLPDEFLTRWLKKNIHFATDMSKNELTEFGKVSDSFSAIFSKMATQFGVWGTSL